MRAVLIRLLVSLALLALGALSLYLTNDARVTIKIGGMIISLGSLGAMVLLMKPQ